MIFWILNFSCVIFYYLWVWINYLIFLSLVEIYLNRKKRKYMLRNIKEKLYGWKYVENEINEEIKIVL